MSEFEKDKTTQENPGDFDRQNSIMHNDVVSDKDTNGISASMIRFGDMDGNKYDEKMDNISAEDQKN